MSTIIKEEFLDWLATIYITYKVASNNISGYTVPSHLDSHYVILTYSILSRASLLARTSVKKAVNSSSEFKLSYFIRISL